MKALDIALAKIQLICDEWNRIKSAQEHKGWMFNYKLYDLSFKCEDADDFDFISRLIFDEWQEAAREAAGYIPETWDYHKYFEHDNHHGSYFNFRENCESSDSLDFWANPIGLEWDCTQGNAWCFTPFEKAINYTYGYTRFSTDKLELKDYSSKEIKEIVEDLNNKVIPALTEILNERKAVIEAYENIKASQCDYVGVCS